MSLPLKVKVNVRDLWDSPESEVKKEFASLKSVLGLDVSAEPQWQLLWTELKAHFKEPEQFVPNIASATAAWARALKNICDMDENEDWVEELLERVKSAGSMLRLELEATRGIMPSTSWSDRARGFQICFPKDPNPTVPMARIMTELMAKFHGDLLQAFNPASGEPAASTSEKWVDAGNDDMSDIDAASIVTPPSTTDRVMAMRSVPMEKLPNINMIERPEDLCARAPYHLILRSSDRHISVQASHQPSLELLAAYLKKWTKTNTNYTNRPPTAEVELRGSVFGLSTMWDRLDIEPQHNDNWTRLSPTLILCFIEGVLGYRMTYQEASVWHFRKDTGFAR